MQWFGKRWEGAICDPAQYSPVTSAMACQQCKKRFEQDSRGVKFLFFAEAEQAWLSRYFHLDCFAEFIGVFHPSMGPVAKVSVIGSEEAQLTAPSAEYYCPSCEKVGDYDDLGCCLSCQVLVRARVVTTATTRGTMLPCAGRSWEYGRTLPCSKTAARHGIFCLQHGREAYEKMESLLAVTEKTLVRQTYNVQALARYSIDKQSEPPPSSPAPSEEKP